MKVGVRVDLFLSFRRTLKAVQVGRACVGCHKSGFGLPSLLAMSNLIGFGWVSH